MAIQRFLSCLLILAGLSVTDSVHAQEFKPVDYKELVSAATSSPDTITVINFWATWCKPCLAEMPYLEELSEGVGGQPVRVILVSMDDEKRWETALRPFLEKRTPDAEIWALKNHKPWDWIDMVSVEWSGAIPATIFLYKGESLFVEEEFSRESLRETMALFLQNSK